MRLAVALIASTATLLLTPVPAALSSTGAHHAAKRKLTHHRHKSKQGTPRSRAAHVKRRPAPKPAPKPPAHPVTTTPVVTSPPVVVPPPVVTTPPVTTTPAPTPPITSPTPQPAAPAIHCDLFASPTGSDSSGNGTLGSPFASSASSTRRFTPGRPVLRAGSYGSTSTWVKIFTNGSPTGQITITAYPGEAATVGGYVDMEGSYTTL